MSKKKGIVLLAMAVLLVVGAGTALAEGYPWRDHARPFDFTFGNHIDTHQQSMIADGGLLKGFFYIRFTGEEQEGYPKAMHGNCNKKEDCTVGWILDGLPMSATLIAHGNDQHPTWCVDPNDLPKQPGYTHFHWLDEADHAGGLEIGEAYDGYLLKLTARETFFFQHHGGFYVDPGIDYETHANIVTDCE